MNLLAVITQPLFDQHNLVVAIEGEARREYSGWHDKRVVSHSSYHSETILEQSPDIISVINPQRIIMHSREVVENDRKVVKAPRFHLGCEHWIEYSPEVGVTATIHVPGGWRHVAITQAERGDTRPRWWMRNVTPERDPTQGLRKLTG